LQSDDTGHRIRRAAMTVAIALAVGFLLVHLIKSHREHVLARDTRTAGAALPMVDVIAVRGSAAPGSLTLPGETAAWYESTIYARVSGYVGKWYVDIGDHVQPGQLLASIDTPEMDAELAAARAKLNVAQSQVKVREADAAFATSTYERWRDSPRGVVSEQEREDKKAGNASAGAQLQAARAQVALDQADVDHYAALEQFKRVTAPYAGTITERRIDIGNLVTAGSATSTTSLYRMEQDGTIRVFVDVPQNAAADLMRVGVPARIWMRSAAEPAIDATVTRTSDAVDPRARTFRVELDVPNPDHRLVSGLYVQVGFQLQNAGMMQIPASALLFQADGPRVAVVGNDGTVHFRAITIARDDGNTVELGSGVSNGERLVLNISNQILDGDHVRVASDGSGTAHIAQAAQ
jgi:RND family efflux transporter MFP subunit